MPADDIFEVAKGYVNNKSVVARIGHSAKLHSLRSAVSSKGSAGSKALAVVGVAFRASLSAIPVPVVGSLISAIETNVEGRIRTWKHRRNLNSAQDLGTQVKFELKELSVEELDRFRWKVSEAIQGFNKAEGSFSTDLAAKQAAQATCDAYLELAIAVQQVVRRLDILKGAVLRLTMAAKLTTDWIETCENGLAVQTTVHPSAPKSAPPPSATAQSLTACLNNVRNTMKDAITAEQTTAQNVGNALGPAATTAAKEAASANYILEKHGKCDRWCCFREGSKADEWRSLKDRSAQVLRILAEPFGPDDFGSGVESFWS